MTEKPASIALKYYVASLINFGFPENFILLLLFRRMSELQSHIKEYILLHPAVCYLKNILWFTVHWVLFICFNGLKAIEFHFITTRIWNKSRRIVADDYVKSSAHVIYLQCFKLILFEQYVLAMYNVTVQHQCWLVMECSGAKIIVYISIMLNPCTSSFQPIVNV
jgi:hypothetical protein